MTRKDLMTQIQAVGIMAVDLHLYLDTHPQNTQAAHEYKKTAEHLKSLKAQYESQFGPLVNFGNSSSFDNKSWINDPWPWERQ